MGPGPDEVGQKDLELLHLWHYSQKIWNPKPKFFFHCRLEDLLSLLSIWTALCHIHLASYAIAKTRENCWLRLKWSAAKVLTSVIHYLDYSVRASLAVVAKHSLVTALQIRCCLNNRIFKMCKFGHKPKSALLLLCSTKYETSIPDNHNTIFFTKITTQNT